MMPRFRLSLLLAALLTSTAAAQSNLPGDQMAADYFAAETAQIRDACLADIKTLDDWTSKREQYRRELLEMLGLDPLPPKTELKAKVLGVVDEPENDFVVERVQYQSRPGLYVTGNVYRPRTVDKPAPAILYVCGHGRVMKNNVSYGNKVHYQHHGAWFARNGYVCLSIDTLQLGEIEGFHHGTFLQDRWWWFNRGYTPAGVEAWNCVRALDYLETRDDVDENRMGVTGRSGGGAYSWWIAAIDERIKAAVPVAGITDLENHVVDGVVEGHCDCMYMVNTFQWDYAKVAALIAPRPLLISNSDRDYIFPLEGVVRTHALVRKIYRLYDADEELALHITAGPHKDTQELRIHAFRWMNHHLKKDDSLIRIAAEKFFTPEQLRVFTPGEEPKDEVNTTTDERFVAAAPSPAPPENAKAWKQRGQDIRDWLDTRVFAAWPEHPEDLSVASAFSETRQGLKLDAYDFTSQGVFRLRLYLLRNAELKEPKLTVLNVHDSQTHDEWLASMQTTFSKVLEGEPDAEPDDKSFESTKRMLLNRPWIMAYVAPRGVGRTRWNPDIKKQRQIKRRFYLLGQSLDGMQIYDIRRAMQVTRSLPEVKQGQLWLQANGPMALMTLYASLYEEPVTRIDAHNLPSSHREGPFLLNIARRVTVPEIVTLAAEQNRVVAYGQDKSVVDHAQKTAAALKWPETQQVQWRTFPAEK